MNKLVDTIQNIYLKEFGKPATAAILTHCKHELMHAIWSHLLLMKNSWRLTSMEC